VVEAAMGGEALVERAFAGMAEWRVTEVVAKRAGFGQVLVEAKRAGKRPGDLGDFERMRQPGAVMIAFMEHEHLGLVGEPTECGRMDDTVAIAPEIAARRTARFIMEAPAGQVRIGRIGRTPGHLGTSPAVDGGLPGT
jgi:hypothetical protein